MANDQQKVNLPLTPIGPTVAPSTNRVDTLVGAILGGLISRHGVDVSRAAVKKAVELAKFAVSVLEEK